MLRKPKAGENVESPNVQRPYIFSIFMSFIVLMATLLVLGFHAWNTRQHILHDSELELHNQAKILGVNIETSLRSYEQQLNFALTLTHLKTLNQPTISSDLLDELRPLTLGEDGILEFRLYDATGVPLFTTAEINNHTNSVVTERFFIKHKLLYEDFVFEAPATHQSEEAPYISLSRARIDKSNEFTGVLQIKVKLSVLQSLMVRDDLRGFDAAEVFFENGKSLISWPADTVRSHEQSKDFNRMLVDYHQLIKVEAKSGSQSNAFGDHFFAIYKIENYPVYIALSQSFASVLSPWFDSTRTLAMVMTIVVVSILGFIFFLFRQMRIDIQRDMTVRRFYAAVEQNHASIMMTDIYGNIEYVNPQFCAISGYSRDQVYGQNTSMLRVDETSSKVSDEIWRTITSGRKWHGELLNRKKNGEIYWELASISPVTNSVGEIINYIAVNEDISERKKIEQELAVSRDELNEIIWGTNVGTWIWNVQTGETVFNDRWAEIIGYSLDEIMPLSFNTWKQLTHPDDFRKSRRLLEKNFAGELDHYESEIRMRHKNGEWVWVLTRGKVVERDAEGRPLRVSGTHTDITRRKLVENRLRVIASVFENSQEGIMITDANNMITDVNPAFTRITGYIRQEILGKSPQQLSSGRQDNDFYDSMWLDLKNNGHWSGEIWNRRKSGEFYAALLSISAIADEHGKVFRHVAVFSDISHIKAQQDELRQIAYYDVLTGIPNRYLLVDRMEQAISQSKRNKNMMAVCYIDLDGFKPINDRLGHDAGDEVLIEVAVRLGNAIRDADTVARLGGDEFVVLLLGLGESVECIETIERMLKLIAQPISIKGENSSVSVSIGVCIYPEHGHDSDTLLKHADEAMYIAKQTGKNCFHIYSEERNRCVKQ